MNEDFPIDVDEIIRHIGEVEAFSLYFPLLGKSLVVDARCDAEERPFIRDSPYQLLIRPCPALLAICPDDNALPAAVKHLENPRKRPCGVRRPLKYPQPFSQSPVPDPQLS